MHALKAARTASCKWQLVSLSRHAAINPSSSCRQLESVQVRWMSEGDGQHPGAASFVSRLWASMRAKKDATDASNGSADLNSKVLENLLVPSTPEARFREVFAVGLPRRPLFPGGLIPVAVHDEKLIQELIQLKRGGAQAYVGAFLRRFPEDRKEQGASFALDSDVAAAVELEPAASAQGDSEAARGAALGDPSEALHDVGTFAQVHTIAPMEGGAQLLLLGHRRLRRLQTVEKEPLKVAVQHLKDNPYEATDDVLRATTMEIVNTLKDLLHLHPLYNEQLKSFAAFGGDFHDVSRLADMGASLTSAPDKALQEVLEQLSVPDRANATLLLLKKEVELCKLQADIGKRVEEKISKDQRRYFLMEQLRSIKKELGLEKDDKSAVIQKFLERIEPVKDKIPEAAQRVIDDEIAKLSALEAASSEFNVTRNYLDWLTSMPWGEFSEERLDIDHAQQVLDEDHYGLEDVKERILEFIAVGRLRGSTQGKILCLVGPPGVGKTSIGRSIAAALGRTYFRFSVGGLSDVAEIKGHRRTYVGAMPGKMVQCLKSTSTSNPFVLIDEIDKLGRGLQGDPASALLELLDPEQNHSFVDHYLDVPVDLSKVLFMCTANVLDTIPQPLLDRMEVIRLSGYTADEKNAIARKYLEPQTQGDAGLPQGSARITDPALSHLIQDYAREAGVRTLKKLLEKIYRKVALHLVKGGAKGPQPAAAASPDAPPPTPLQSIAGVLPVGTDAQPATPPSGPDDGQESTTSTATSTASTDSTAPSAPAKASSAAEQQQAQVVVDMEQVKDYVGQPPFTSDRLYGETPVGVVMGLAWTAMGGSTLYVEAAAVQARADGERKGHAALQVTGQLGDVMKESATIAHTYSRAYLARADPGNTFLQESTVHLHVPAGATPKDGPSAGCTIITALLSLALDKPVVPDLAMTGEVTLTGRVLPIGGVKEKTLAARRSGVRTLIFPEGNRRDYDELSDAVKAGLDAHFVESYDQVFKLAFGGSAEQQQQRSLAEAGIAS